MKNHLRGRPGRGIQLILAGVLFLFLGFAWGDTPKDTTPPPLTDLSLEELMNIEVTSVSRKVEPAFDAAAALFVITQEDIKGSGYTTLPEIFRLVPGMHVARIGGGEWAISVRGFNSSLSDKLLVLIDGRSVYTPGYSGVNWDVQNILLEDIERIEVIRGPGGTMWGANAVNGVINIVTKKAQDTQGLSASAWHGPLEQGDGEVRFGGSLGKKTFFRVHYKQARRGDDLDIPHLGEGNSLKDQRGGFRVDWEPNNRNDFTLQGDMYQFRGETVSARVLPDPPYIDINPDFLLDHGFNLLGRWTGKTTGGGEFQAQTYFDHYDRDYALVQERVKTLDFDFQFRLPSKGHHDLVWGAGVRHIHDDFENSFSLQMNPKEESSTVLSAFMQDQVSWNEGRTRFIAGTKLEHNPFTGYEVQPSLRLAQRFGPSGLGWIAVSRAVRTPSKLIRDVQVLAAQDTGWGILLLKVQGNPEIDSESLTALEAGFRWRHSDRFTLDLTAFYNDYEDLTMVHPGDPYLDTKFIPPQVVYSMAAENGGNALVRGFEATAEFRPLPRWRLIGSISYMNFDAWLRPGHPDDVFMPANPTDNPDWQYSLRSSARLGRSWQFDLSFRRVGQLDLPRQTVGIREGIPAYTEADARLSVQLSKHFELAVAGQNLLHANHLEFTDVLNFCATHYSIPRSLYVKATFQY